MTYGIYDASGATRVTVVSGATRTGLYAADGSLNVVVATGLTYVGYLHPCGALWVTLTTTRTGHYAPDGSMYVAQSSGLGALFVIVVSGSLGGVTTPVLAMDPLWDSTDNTPQFTITFDATVTAGDDLRVQVQAAGGDWSVLVTNTLHDITAPEDVADAVSLANSSLANSDYEVRANITTTSGTSAWSNIVSFTVAATNAWQLEASTDHWQLEDASGNWILEA